MDWESLRPVIVGGLIATIPILISNLVQIYLKRMEIKQKEKEAKIQAKEKWIERDILAIMGSIEQLLKTISTIASYELWRDILDEDVKAGMYSEEEYFSKLKLNTETIRGLGLEKLQTLNEISRLVWSFEDEIIEGYNKFNTAITEYIREKNKEIQGLQNESGKKWLHVRFYAGIFHAVLRDKLISIRDSE